MQSPAFPALTLGVVEPRHNPSVSAGTNLAWRFFQIDPLPDKRVTTFCSMRVVCFNWLSSSFAGECPAYYGRFFRDDGQVRARGRVRLTAALLPFLQCAFADAIGAREFGL